MPQLLKHHKVKRPAVLVRKIARLKNYPKCRSYKPLCQKLRNNNNTLAKALSKEKQETRLLFSQKVALMAEVQSLGAACNRRDVAISTILDSAKQMLNALVTMTTYVTKTISCCQEFISSTSAVSIQSPPCSAGRHESLRRDSSGNGGKPLAKGVVKPMVSGHTITKPTINLSRVNMQHVNNSSSSLSVIEEVRTPPRNQGQSDLPVQRRCESSRRCRMPERVTIPSPRRSSEGNESRLSRRNSRLSTRVSDRRSSSSRFAKKSLDSIERMGSPTVKLTDVSKLLQNSQTINLRELNESLNNTAEATRVNVIPETPPSDQLNESTESGEHQPVEEENQSIGSNGLDESVDDSFRQKSSEPTADDPLEGPSWLYNNSILSKTHKGSSINNLNTSCAEKTVRNSFPDVDVSNNSETNVTFDECNAKESKSTSPSTDQESSNQESSAMANFVTLRRGYQESEEEDIDDFTLIYRQHPRNMNFDFNDLKLPVIEESLIKRNEVVPETQPEITTTIRQITQTIPLMHNASLRHSMLDQSTVKLPLVLQNGIEDIDPGFLVEAEQEIDTQAKKLKKSKLDVSTASSNDESFIINTPLRKKKGKQNAKRSNKDPSAAKVVLQKLSDADVKMQSPNLEDSMQRWMSYPVLPEMGDCESDYDSSGSSNNSYAQRLRRKRATNLQEPSLRAKLRRNR